MITDDPHRAHMALAFGKHQLALGHPLTVFLNDRGVFIAAQQRAERFGLHQGLIAELLAAVAKVVACRMCMKHHGIAQADLVEGLEAGQSATDRGRSVRAGYAHHDLVSRQPEPARPARKPGAAPCQPLQGRTGVPRIPG